VKKDFWSIFKPDRGRNRPGGDRSRPGAGRRVPRKYQQRCPRSVSCLLEDFSAPTSLLDLPAEHHERIRHTNLLEHTFGESRRRVKVIGRLPGEYSCLSLVWAILDRASVGWRGFETSVVGIRRLQDLRCQLLPERELAAVGRAGPGKPSGQLLEIQPPAFPGLRAVLLVQYYSTKALDSVRRLLPCRSMVRGQLGWRAERLCSNPPDPAPGG